ncbi:MAG TPA: 16S rRNA (guanine(966)-N(2))-methyltransferase RsmD [Candidatus Limnocylindrales bacterium]|nr:16S rRNA (guanine(966)-N(2))-methyltransferase RsmD [Candidatus Limnocylindrales bacterium]
MADAGRVIAGSAKGIRLRAPGAGTRPLADRVKQTLFAILEPELDGARVLDLFAGSGAGGIEALSRGAAAAIFVEKDQGAAAVIDANLRATGLAGPTVAVIRWDVVRWLAEPNVEAAFDLVLVDPPYAETELLTRVLEILGADHAPLAPDARVVAKHFWRDRPPERIGRLAHERDRRFGETALTFYRRTGSEPPASEESG